MHNLNSIEASNLTIFPESENLNWLNVTDTRATFPICQRRYSETEKKLVNGYLFYVTNFKIGFFFPSRYLFSHPSLKNIRSFMYTIDISLPDNKFLMWKLLKKNHKTQNGTKFEQQQKCAEMTKIIKKIGEKKENKNRWFCVSKHW